MPAKKFPAIRHPRPQASGFSLVELMVAMLLGLLVVAAAGGVFLSNKRVYAASETLGRIQENTRVAFELMSRDIREAGGNPCGGSGAPKSMLTTATDPFWDRFGQGITGYMPTQALPLTPIGTGPVQRVAGTDAVELHSSLGDGVRVVSHTTPGANVQLASNTDFAAGDILLICNVSQSFVFQVTQLTSSGGNPSIQHNGGGGQSLNCSQTFQVEGCAPGNSGENYCFTRDPSLGGPNNCDFGSTSPARVVRVGSVQWYVGNNDRQGRSLYRKVITNRGNTGVPNTTLDTAEIVEGVEDMTVTYLEQGEAAYTDATGVGNWARVVSTRIELQLTGTEGALGGGEIEGTDGEVLTRTLAHVVSLRNREGSL